MGRPLKHDIQGKTFGRLLVIRRDLSRSDHAYWFCRCACGRSTTTTGSAIVHGLVRSCGCLSVETKQNRATHGATRGSTRGAKRHPEYWIWNDIIRRCENPRHHAYADYGGRGIKIWHGWRKDYAAFIAHIGRRPTVEHTLDRKNVNGDYAPGNVRWATRKQQARNKRNNLIVLFRGRSMTLAEAVELTGIRYSLAYARLHAGWPLEEALAPGRQDRSRHIGPPTASVAALGRACQAAGLTLDDIKRIATRNAKKRRVA